VAVMVGGWLLDDGPFGVLAREVPAGQLTSIPAGTFLLARATADAASQDQLGLRPAALRAVAGDGSPVFRVVDVTVNSVAGAILYRHLRSNYQGTADLGEHEAIAWLLAEASAVQLVTSDKLAAFLALSELGPGRVCHPYDVWYGLHDGGYVDTEVLARLVARSGKQDPSIPSPPYRFRQP